MTEEEKKVAKPEKEDVKKEITKPKKQKTSSSSAGLKVIIFFIFIATCGGIYYLWENDQQSNIKYQLLTSRIDQDIENLKQQKIDSTAAFDEQIQGVTSAQENLRHNLTNLIKNNDHLRNDWLLAEAEYLVQLANYRLLLEKDVTTAIVALKAADARLTAVIDPALLNIRKILARDLQTLKNIQIIDLAGLSVTISALSSNITNLPLSTPDPKTHKITTESKSQSNREVKSLNELPSAIWNDIKSLIVIRNHNKPIEPLLAPEQHFYLVQNLVLLLEQTRLALLNGHNEIYQERLKTTIKWITQFFDTEHNITRNMLTSLEELLKFDIDPALPDISTTYSVINKYRLHGLQPAAPTAAPSAPVAKVKNKS